MSEIAKVSINLDIRGEQEDAFDVIDRLLDHGMIQDLINGHDFEGPGKLKVVNAEVCDRIGEIKKPFTVVGFHEDNLRRYVDHVETTSAQEALDEAPRIVRVVAVFPGHIKDECGADEVPPAREG